MYLLFVWSSGWSAVALIVSDIDLHFFHLIFIDFFTQDKN